MKRLHAHVRPLVNLFAGNNGDTIVHRREQELLRMVLIEGAVYLTTNVPYPMISLGIGMIDYIRLKWVWVCACVRINTLSTIHTNSNLILIWK
jgi:hypothetical protein